MAIRALHIANLQGTRSQSFRINPAGTTGAPASGTWPVGTLYMDSAGTLWRCTAAGTPGTWASVSGAIGGSIANTQVAVGSGANTIAGSSSFTWNGTSLIIGGNVFSTTAGATRVGFLDVAGASNPDTYYGIDYDSVNNRGRLDALSGGVAWRDITICSRGGSVRLAQGGGSVIAGTDPGGSELLRVGGSARVGGALTVVGAVEVAPASTAATDASPVFGTVAHTVRTTTGLGTTLGNRVNLQNWTNTNSNGGYLRLIQRRWAAGSDWQTAEMKLQMVTDVSEQAFLSFRGNTGAGVVSLGTGNTEKFIFDTLNGALIIGTDPGGSESLRVGGSIKSNASILSISPTGGIGYGGGSGGIVTQTTSRSTGVTINKINGEIILVSAAGSSTATAFTVTNSAMAETDHVVVCQKSGTDFYETFITKKAAGSFQIMFYTTGGSTTEQPVFSFSILKGWNA